MESHPRILCKHWLPVWLQLIDTHPWWCWETKRQTPLSPLTDYRLFWTDGWMIQGRDAWKNWSWQHFITLGSQKGLVVINSCWEHNLDSLPCVQVCVHSTCLQPLLLVSILCELCYNLQKWLWRLWLNFYLYEYKRIGSNAQVGLLLL